MIFMKIKTVVEVATKLIKNAGQEFGLSSKYYKYVDFINF